MKVLAFDTWTKGAHHFERLVPALSAQGITLILVHLGSWGNDPGRPRQERIGSLEVRDIAFYGSASFEEVLDIERPDAVIFLWTQSIAHRAFNRYCRQRFIPTLNLYHGLLSVLVNSKEGGSYKINRLAYTKFVFSKLGKTLKHTLPCYISSLIRTRARIGDWVGFISDLMKMAIGKSSLVAADDARTNKCAVYTSADAEHAVRTYGFASEDVFAVGNPDLARFGLTQSMLGSWSPRSASDRKTIMYIDTGLAGVGLVFSSREAFRDHLITTSRALAKQGIGMRFKPKPHPADVLAFLEQSLDGTGIELISNENFLGKLRECAACVVESTTLALIPALMGMPLLYANYNELRQLRFGPALTSYPRGYMLRNVSDVSNILDEVHKRFDPGAINDWISLNAGPLPPDMMPYRVADVVKSMLTGGSTPHSVQ